MRRLAALNVVVATLLSLGAANAAEITGAGSTFVYPILAKWSADYSVKSGTRSIINRLGLVAVSHKSKRLPWTSALPTCR